MAAPDLSDIKRAKGPKILLLAGVSAFALLIGLGAGVSFLGNPDAGEPVATLDLPITVQDHASGSTVAHAAPQPQEAAEEAPPAAPPGPVTQPVYAGRALVADPALIENTPTGPLPRIADDGRRPLRAYAAANPGAGKPRIAIVISGFGSSEKATTAALAGLPTQVSLSFAPYAADVQRWASEARKAGHETLVELPMEPFDYPDSDPGPNTLRSGIGESANTQRLVWALSRFTGYVGVTNLGTGGRFLSDGNSLAPVMTFVTRRGLMFFDNGSTPQSVASVTAPQVGAAFAQASGTIDSVQAAAEIDRRLSDLETQARADGFAIGSGTLYPVTIDRVSQWAKGLAGRGFVLVPVSAIIDEQK